MCKAAMVREAERGTAEAAEDVQVWSFGGERERKSSQSSLAVEPGASHTGAGQEVGDGFQAVRKDSMGTRAGMPTDNEIYFVGDKRVSASGTAVISAGRVPRSSPSAST